jgi:hypothetical protein
MLRAMATTPPASPASAHLATASGVLLGTLCASIAIGAAIGAAFGSWQLGALGGAVVGIPLSVAVVYLVYGRSGAQT